MDRRLNSHPKLTSDRIRAVLELQSCNLVSCFMIRVLCSFELYSASRANKRQCPPIFVLLFTILNFNVFLHSTGGEAISFFNFSQCYSAKIPPILIAAVARESSDNAEAGYPSAFSCSANLSTPGRTAIFTSYSHIFILFFYHVTQISGMFPGLQISLMERLHKFIFYFRPLYDFRVAIFRKYYMEIYVAACNTKTQTLTICFLKM